MISNEKQFWSVGLSEWGRWQVRRAPVEDPSDYSLVEDLGPELLAAALEFDGDYQVIDTQRYISLTTEQTPWLFVITTSKKLYVKKVGAPLNEALLLATDAVQLSAGLGFKSAAFNQDQGLFLAYLTSDGRAFVRVRKKQPNTQVYWGDATELAVSELNTRVQVLRLLDFRVGVYVAGANKLYISTRNYIGDTIKSEHVFLNAGVEFSTFPFRDMLNDNVEPLTITEVTREDNYTIRATTSHPTMNFDPTFPLQISLSSTNAGQAIQSITFQETYMLFHMLKPISELEKDVFSIGAINRMGYIASPQCRPIWPALTFQLNPPPFEAATDYVYINASGSISEVGFVEIVESNLPYTETVSIQATGAVTLALVEVMTSSKDVNEFVYMNATATITLAMVQVGSSPI